MQNYKELKVWSEAHNLTLEIYSITSNFPNTEKFGITSQLRRSTFSIPSNIAEGCGKSTQNDLAKFLQIALGSANETDYLILLSKDLGYISESAFLSLEDKINKIKAMLISLIKKVKSLNV